MHCNIASMATPQFPAGLRVLVVDDDPICLKIMEKMLSRCLYTVTTASRATIALSMLRGRKGEFDLVLSDVYMPDMDGFKLLELIGLEMDIPVIMMSADDGSDVVMKGVEHGARDYLIKPVRIEALRNIWQHVVRMRNKRKVRDLENSGSVEDGDRGKRSVDDGEIVSSVNEGSWKSVKTRREGKEEEDEVEDHEDSSNLKKARVVWSVELHQQFVNAVNQLGVEKAVPKKILELMNVTGLTRENVASHLQKYRLYLRRVSVPHYQGRFDASFTGATDGIFGSSSSLDVFDLQAFASSGQLPTQNLISMHGGPRRVANTAAGLSAADQISFFNSDANCANPLRIRSAPGQPLNNKEMNLLCGTSADIESTQLGQAQPALQSYGGMSLQVTEGPSGFTNLPSSLRTSSSYPGGANIEQLSNSFAMQITHQGQLFPFSQKTSNVPIDISCQTQWRGQLLNEMKGSQNSLFLPPTGQQAKGTTTNGHTSINGAYTNISSYGVVPQTEFAEFENSSITESTGSYFPLGSCMGASNHNQVSMLQETHQATRNIDEISNGISLKGVRDSIPNYDLGQLRQIKGQAGRLQNINLPYESAQQLGSKQNHFGFGPSNTVHQNLSANLRDGGRNTCIVTKDVISARTEFEREGGCIGRHNAAHLVENYAKVKAEVPDLILGDIRFTDNIFPNELMTVIGRRQPQGGAGQDEPEFNFDGFPFDDISV